MDWDCETWINATAQMKFPISTLNKSSEKAPAISLKLIYSYQVKLAREMKSKEISREPTKPVSLLNFFFYWFALEN